MNPLTLVKRLNNINAKEAELGISEEASWHAKYKDSAYVYVGGLPFDLTEGDLLAVFSQCGEIVDVNLVRDKGTGKSRGFAFIAYEDQRSTNLAVDNLNGAQILGRILRVDHVAKYKKKEEEDEETERQKREARGVCRAFQRGECTRGAGCKFSHDEQRAANTGWGWDSEDKGSKWGHDKFEGSRRGAVQERARLNERDPVSRGKVDERESLRNDGKEGKRTRRYDDEDVMPKSRGDYNRPEERSSGDKDPSSWAKGHERAVERSAKEVKRARYHDEDVEPRAKEDYDRRQERGPMQHNDNEFESMSREEKRDRRHNKSDFEPRSREGHYRREEKRSMRNHEREFEMRSAEDRDRGEEKRSRRQEAEPYSRDNQRKREADRGSSHVRDSSYRHGERDDYRHKSDRQSMA